MSNDHLDLIAKMLRKAERTDNEHEAAAFMQRAQTLATRHSIDLAVARAHTAKAEKREQVEEVAVEIGTPGKRGLALYTQLFLDIAQVNDIKCLIAHDSSTVYAMGFPSDVEVAKALYASLVVQMVQAGDAYIKSGEYKSETVWVPGHYKKTRRYWNSYWGEYEYDEEWVEGKEKPVDGRVARRSFYNGFRQKVVARLREAKNEAVAAAEAESTSSEVMDETTGKALSSMALVLREKSKEVDAFYTEKAKRARGSWKGGSRASAGHTSSAARRAGTKAGASARLSGNAGIGAGRSRIGA